MAKIPFSKLGIKNNGDIATVVWGEYDIEVKKYLPIAEKVELVSRIINLSADDNGFYNPLKLKVYIALEATYAYTNLSFTAKMKEDELKLYDLLVSSGLFAAIVDAIPQEEWSDLQNSVWSTISNIYDYKNSIMGILDTVNSDYENLNLDATEIQAKLGDKENLDLLRQILTKLG